jgi:maltooligosyltrehalose trehalohydrolase
MNSFLQKIGAWCDGAATEFIVWAPNHENVRLFIASPEEAVYPMEKDDIGYWRLTIPVRHGTRYGFRPGGGEDTLPDPASLSQPDGVHGLSRVVERAALRRDDGDRKGFHGNDDDRKGFHWTDADWKELPLSNRVIYELHTGTFSPTHDFEGIERKLDYLLDLGVNTIELMPLGQFPGDRNWGYDGAYPFAVQHSYGGVEGFMRLVDAAHAKGISVMVDVVYNHLGPEGNYLHRYGPYFTDRYRTPWGNALNFDGAWSDGVRNFFLQNARMWLEDLHVDALRLDAVHAIFDNSAVTFLQQLKELANDIGQRTGWKRELIAETDANDPRLIDPPVRGGYGLDGQWVDDFHHALRALLTSETNAYYEDFGSITQLEKAFRNTFVYDGVYSRHRKRTFGGRADANPYDQFVVFAQNHDHVGNRAAGDRLTQCLSPEQLKLAAATVLLSPYVPLLFMGEEYGETNPFLFFVSFGDPALVDAVRKGRLAEFKTFTDDGGAAPDPQSPDTFDRSVLSWQETTEPGATLLRYYRELIRLRKTRPALQGRTRDTMIVHPATGMTLPIERNILNDQLYIWFHYGGEATSLQNITGQRLRKVFDSADRLWRGPNGGTPQEAQSGVSATRPEVPPEALAGDVEVPPGAFFELAPWSAAIFEKQ